ncbi:MAG: hypothetical protein MUF73_11970 [Rhodobacteraceae bacterium]|jgi:hypothetical protein|nr:hypothetical protein [Paracoccaceae bacterium]
MATELFSVYLCLLITAFFLGWGAKAAWQAGYGKVTVAVLFVLVVAGALLLYLGSIATGAFLAGLGETLIGLFLLTGPAAGILLGSVAARWQRAGLALGVLYGVGLAAALSGVT